MVRSCVHQLEYSSRGVISTKPAATGRRLHICLNQFPPDVGMGCSVEIIRCSFGRTTAGSLIVASGILSQELYHEVLN